MDVEGSVRIHGVGLYVKNNVEVVSISVDFPNANIGLLASLGSLSFSDLSPHFLQ